MPTKTKQQTYPFTLRLTTEQRARLEAKAGGIPLGEYIRHKALSENEAETLELSKDQTQIVASWVLGGLGQSRQSEHLGAIAQAASQELVIITPEESTVVMQACADITTIRERLMRVSSFRKAANDH